MTQSSAVLRIIEWLSGDVCHDCSTAELIEGLGERLRSAGLPLDRLVLHLRTLHPEILGRTLAWSPGEAVEVHDRPHGIELTVAFSNSPVWRVIETKEPVLVRVGANGGYIYSQVDVYRDRRLTELLFIPLKTSGGPVSVAAFCCGRPEGFSPDDRTIIEQIVPALRNVCEVRILRAIEQTLLDTYTGATTAQHILAGQIRRGQLESLEAALLLCDLRGFTELSNRLPAERVAQLLDAYFDRLVPVIIGHGGEIVKFMGDAVLAFFRRDDAAEACQVALKTAIKVIENLEAHLESDEPLHAGVALHYGVVSYGNIGSSKRLDFTVIGPDVNLISRIQGVCSETGRVILTSQQFAKLLGEGDVQPIGRFALKGFRDPVELFSAVR
jgi:adenylate cyclase